MVLKPITKNEIVNALHSVGLTKGHTVAMSVAGRRPLLRH